MLRKLTLLPATMVLTLAIGGCEEGDFEEGPEMEADTEVIEPEVRETPPAERSEFEQESELQPEQQPAERSEFEQESDLQLEQQQPAESGDLDASTDEPVEVEQDVNVPQSASDADQPEASQPNESDQGESEQ